MAFLKAFNALPRAPDCHGCTASTQEAGHAPKPPSATRCQFSIEVELVLRGRRPRRCGPAGITMTCPYHRPPPPRSRRRFVSSATSPALSRAGSLMTAKRWKRPALHSDFSQCQASEPSNVEGWFATAVAGLSITSARPTGAVAVIAGAEGTSGGKSKPGFTTLLVPAETSTSGVARCERADDAAPSVAWGSAASGDGPTEENNRPGGMK